jgi:hypothetical protein
MKKPKPIELMGGYQPLPEETPESEWRTGEGYYPLGTYPPYTPPPPPPGARSGSSRFAKFRREEAENNKQ